MPILPAEDVLTAALRGLVREFVAEALAQSLETSPAEVSSVRLPADAAHADAFNRACRSGRVVGARKVGRIWLCSLENWNRRAAAPRPQGLPKRPSNAAAKRVSTVTRDVDVLAELGLESGRRAG